MAEVNKQEEHMYENYYTQMAYGQQLRRELVSSVERDRLVQIARGEGTPRRLPLRLAADAVVAYGRAVVKAFNPDEAIVNQCCAPSVCC